MSNRSSLNRKTFYSALNTSFNTRESRTSIAALNSLCKPKPTVIKNNRVTDFDVLSTFVK